MPELNVMPRVDHVRVFLPKSDLLEEQSWSTQPIPTKPPPLECGNLRWTRSILISFISPFHPRRECRGRSTLARRAFSGRGAGGRAPIADAKCAMQGIRVCPTT